MVPVCSARLKCSTPRLSFPALVVLSLASSSVTSEGFGRQVESVELPNHLYRLYVNSWSILLACYGQWI